MAVDTEQAERTEQAQKTEQAQQAGQASPAQLKKSASEALQRLMSTAIEEAIEAVSEGETLIPFVALVDAGGKLVLRRFVDGTVDQAKAFLGAMEPAPVLACVCADAYLNTDTGQQDAIIVQGYSPDLKKSLIGAQRYIPAVEGAPARRLGEPQIINRGENPLSR